MIIYKITNNINSKTYIGKTTRSVQDRWYQHKKAAANGVNTILYKAIRKYGPQSFSLQVVERVEDNLNEAEIRWIQLLSPEYNMTGGGDGGWINDQTGNRWKVKDPSKMGKNFREGNTHSKEWYSSVAGENNYQSRYKINTPWGCFYTWRQAISAARALKNQGRKDVVTDTITLKKYCKEDIILSSEGRRTFPLWRGKNTTQLGFYIESKEKDE